MTGMDHTSVADDLPILAVDVSDNERDFYVIHAKCEEVLLLKVEPQRANNTPLSEDEIIVGQANDSHITIVATQVCHFISEFTIEKTRLLFRNS